MDALALASLGGLVEAADTSSSIGPALIAAAATVAVGLITLATVLMQRRTSNPEQGRPDDSYRNLVRRVGVLELFLGLRRFDTSKIRTGRESDERTKITDP